MRGSLDWDNGPSLSPTLNPRRATAGVLQDPVAMHLLLETAVGDSAAFDIMTLEELEDVKQEEATIARRLPSLRRDLQLEMKLRDAAQSFNRMSDQHRGADATPSDEYIASAKKCDDMSAELYNLERRATALADQRLKHTAAVLQIDYEQRTGQAEFQKVNGDEDDWASGFNLRSIAPGGLADTFDGIMDIPGVGDPHTDATLNDLWLKLSSHDAQHGLSHDEQFSLEGFSYKVQALCDRASSLEADLQAEQARAVSSDALQDAHDSHLATQKKLQDSQADLMEARGSLDQVKQELKFVKEQHEFRLNDEVGREREAHEATRQAHEAMRQQHDGVLERHETFLREHQTLRKQHDDHKTELDKLRSTQDQEQGSLSAEVARLQTEVTIARAELDGAYGSRAERAADIAENPEFKARMESLEARNNELQKELRDLVSEHEDLTRQGVDAERDREGLEATIDELREKVETLELRIREDRLRHMGRDPEAANTPGGGDTRSISVMRAEFKKMMRESRTEQLKVLKVSITFPPSHGDLMINERLQMEQEERRKLEAALRQLRKESGASSPGLSPATLSPPPLPRSNLRQNVTAS